MGTIGGSLINKRLITSIEMALQLSENEETGVILLLISHFGGGISINDLEDLWW